MKDLNNFEDIRDDGTHAARGLAILLILGILFWGGIAWWVWM